LVIWCQWETIGPCKAEDANSLNQSRDCPNAQASQAGVIIFVYEDFFTPKCLWIHWPYVYAYMH
jgi:hypothetical protein